MFVNDSIKLMVINIAAENSRLPILKRTVLVLYIFGPVIALALFFLPWEILRWTLVVAIGLSIVVLAFTTLVLPIATVFSLRANEIGLSEGIICVSVSAVLSAANYFLFAHIFLELILAA